MSEDTFIGDLLDIALEEADLSSFSREELGDIWRRADEYIALLMSARRKAAKELATILDAPLVLPSGVVLRSKRTVKRTGWRNDDLSEALEAWCTRHLIDRETGEVVKAFDPRRTLAVFEPAKGRTKNLAAAGIRIKDFCTEEWDDSIEVLH